MFSQILFKLPQHLFLHQKVSGETFLPPQVLFMPPQHFFIHQKLPGDTFLSSQILFMPPQHFFIHQKVPGDTFLSSQILSTLLHQLFNTKNISSHKIRPLTRAASSFSSIQLRLHLTLLHTFVKSKPECVLLFRN